MADFEKSGFRFSLIDEPMQKHVVAWERARVDMQNDEPKDILQGVVYTLNSISVTERSMDVLFMTLNNISKSITAALESIRAKQSMTVSSDRSQVLEAALRSGWVISLTELQNDVWNNILERPVDELKPWVVTWMSKEIASLYNRTQTIPKN